jgi:hypothetical protein
MYTVSLSCSALCKGQRLIYLIYLKHTDIYNDGIKPAQYVLRDIFLTCFHFDRGLYLERFSFSLPV